MERGRDRDRVKIDSIDMFFQVVSLRQCFILDRGTGSVCQRAPWRIPANGTFPCKPRPTPRNSGIPSDAAYKRSKHWRTRDSAYAHSNRSRWRLRWFQAS